MGYLVWDVVWRTDKHSIWSSNTLDDHPNLYQVQAQLDSTSTHHDYHGSHDEYPYDLGS